MPLPPHIDLVVFSGTGNTLLAAQRLALVLAQHERHVRWHRLEHTTPTQLAHSPCLGLAFPVAAQSTFPLVWQFLRNLPPAQGTHVFMLDTMQSYSGGIVGPLRDILVAKGYQPIGAREIRMPMNILRRRINEQADRAIVERGLRQAESYALDLLEGRAGWPSNSLWQKAMYAMGYSSLTWRVLGWLGHRIRLDRQRCTQCGLCASICPTGNITLVDGSPALGSACQQCMRCMAFCPTQALTYPFIDFSRYRACTWSAFPE